ncbi:hypothetical protein [Nostoc sp.]
MTWTDAIGEMKINRFGRAEILTPEQINVLFTEGFVNPRDRALFGVCLYAACRINEACTLAVKDVLWVVFLLCSPAPLLLCFFTEVIYVTENFCNVESRYNGRLSPDSHFC